MSNWRAADVPDLSDRTVVVTGANSGLGKAATEVFANHGATVVMACRSTERGATAADEIRADDPAGELTVEACDLGDLASVRSFADRLHEEHDRLDVLCNNAGVMAIPRRETADGFETQIGVNHLGHFALTGQVLELLRETPGESRVVTQSSGLHERGEIDLDDLHGEDSYDRWDAYARSKLANVLFAYELDRRIEAAGVDDVTSVACHPGYAATNLQGRASREGGNVVTRVASKIGNAVLAQSAAAGALPMLYAATADDVEGGSYYGPGGFMDMRGAPERQRSSDRSYDPETAAALWERSAALTDVTYDLPPSEAVASADASASASADAE